MAFCGERRGEMWHFGISLILFAFVAKFWLSLMDMLSVTSPSAALTVNLELIKSAFHSDLSDSSLKCSLPNFENCPSMQQSLRASGLWVSIIKKKIPLYFKPALGPIESEAQSLVKLLLKVSVGFSRIQLPSWLLWIFMTLEFVQCLSERLLHSKIAPDYLVCI